MTLSARRRLGLLASGVLALSLAATLSPVVPIAQAASPVAAPDSATMRADRTKTVDVLANDTDPDGGPLEICRLADVPEELLVADLPSGRNAAGEVLVVMAFKPGTYTFRYFACDLETLSPATVTITVTPAPRLRLKVKKLDGRPGRIAIRNRGERKVNFLWGSWEEKKPDGRIVVRSGHREVISVRRRSIVWAATSRRPRIAKIGFVRGIDLPRGVDPLPPGAPDKDDLTDLLGRRAAWWG